MPFKTIIKYLTLTGLILIVCIQAAFISLPLIADALIKQKFGKELNEFQLDFTTNNIGFSRTLIRDLSFGEDLKADTVELVYTIKNFNSFQLEKITVLGLSSKVHLLDGQKIKFNSFVFPTKENKNDKNNHSISKLDFKKITAFLPRQIRIKNSHIKALHKSTDFLIPIDLMAVIDPEEQKADVKVSLKPNGQNINIGISGDFIDKSLAFKAMGQQIQPDCIIPKIPIVPGNIRFSGPLDFKIESDDLTEWRINASGINIDHPQSPKVTLKQINGLLSIGSETFDILFRSNGIIKLSSPGLSIPDFSFTMDSTLNKETSPKFNLSLKNLEEGWTLKGEQVDWLPALKKLSEDLSILNSELSLSLSGDLEDQTCKLDISSESIINKINAEIVKTGPVQLNTEFKGNLFKPNKDNFISFKSKFGELNWTSGSNTIGLKNLHGKGNLKLHFPKQLKQNDRVHFLGGNVELTSSSLFLQTGSDTAKIPNISFKAKVKQSANPSGLSLGIDGSFSQAKFNHKQANGTVQKGGISGIISFSPDYTHKAVLKTRLGNMDATLIKHPISIKGLSLELPMTYPFKPNTSQGTFLVKHTSYAQKAKASLSGSINQTADMAFNTSGRIDNTHIPGLYADFNIDAGLDLKQVPWADAMVKTNQFLLTQEELSSIVPTTNIPGSFQIDLSTQAKIQYQRHQLNTSAVVNIHDGSIDFPGLDLTALGITGNISFNNLEKLESVPGQLVSIKSIDAGQFKFDNADIRFSIEDGKSLNIENLKLNWCNGLVSTESIRLPAPDNRLSLTLYCDRLEMDSLLRQIGAFDARGGGTLNGRIPVIYRDGDISFDDGFLFSTPGQGGRVFVKDLDRMLEGFPKDTPEFSQLDLAGEALKDFQYEWAKLKMNTQGDTLAVHMELDGKPAAVLPFEYNKKLNSFARVDAKSPGSKFQGVKLDVNLKLPFNRVMKFGNKLKNIMD